MAIIDKKMGDKSHKMIYSANNDRRTEIIPVDDNKKNIFSLTTDEILKLSKWVVLIEKYYSEKEDRWFPVDVEWAIDGLTNELYIIQSRPETVCSRKYNNNTELVEYKFKEKTKLEPILWQKNLSLLL